MHDTFDHLEPKERVVALWRSTSLSMVKIGEMCGFTKNAVAGIVHRANVSREAERVILDAKDPALQADAVRRVQAGENIRHVAYEYNVTPFAVQTWMSKILSPTIRRTAEEKARARKNQRQRENRARKRAMARAAMPPKSPKVEKPAPPPPPKEKPHRVTLFGLRLGMCRDVQQSNVYGGRYCGDPVKPGSSYCPAHHALYYIKPAFHTKKQRTNYAMRQPAMEPA